MSNLKVMFFAISLLLSWPALGNDVMPGPYHAEILDVIDGDTFRARIQVWLGQEIETLVRLDNIDTPELKGKCASEKDMALIAKQNLHSLLEEGDVLLRDIHYGKYAGRIIASAVLPNGQDISEILLSRNPAYEYHGKKRKNYC